MLLIFVTLAIGGIAGLATGGSFRHFPSVRLEAFWLALAAIALQFANPGGWLGHAAVLTSFVLLITFAVVNLETPGMLLLLVGISLNAIVIAANGGMPITRDAIVDSGQQATITELQSGGGGAKHRLADASSTLLVLGDVVGIPAPIGAAVSVGDLVMYVGVAWYVAAATKPRDRR